MVTSAKTEGQVATLARDGDTGTPGVAVVSLLFGLAVLNDFAIAGPGEPLRWPGPSEFVVAILAGLLIAGVAWFIDSRAAGLRGASTKRPTHLILLSVVLGVAMGQLILGQMVVLAQVDQGSQQRYLRFVSEPVLHPLHRTFSAAVIEETLFRYVGMTVVALVVARRLARPRLAYRVALIGTAAVFAIGHLPAFSVVGLVIVLFNLLAGLLYGWMFWHWGLMYAILAHFAAGSVRGLIVGSFGSRLFS